MQALKSRRETLCASQKTSATIDAVRTIFGMSRDTSPKKSPGSRVATCTSFATIRARPLDRKYTSLPTSPCSMQKSPGEKTTCSILSTSFLRNCACGTKPPQKTCIKFLLSRKDWQRCRATSARSGSESSKSSDFQSNSNLRTSSTYSRWFLTRIFNSGLRQACLQKASTAEIFSRAWMEP
eukprot:7155123-Prymnesium_polylepis.1